MWALVRGRGGSAIVEVLAGGDLRREKVGGRRAQSGWTASGWKASGRWVQGGRLSKGGGTVVKLLAGSDP